MLKAVLGYYENGVITLDEYPEFDYKVPVIVTFLNGYNITKIIDGEVPTVSSDSIEAQTK